MPVLFQITVALQHDIKVLGVTELYDNLPAQARSGCLCLPLPMDQSCGKNKNTSLRESRFPSLLPHMV